MTYAAACQLFYDYGNVGRSLEEIMLTEPTKCQLEDAINQAIFIKKRDSKTVKEAAQIIREYWFTHHQKVEKSLLASEPFIVEEK